MPVVPFIPLIAAGIGGAVALKGQSEAKKAAQAALDAQKAGQVNIGNVSQMATDQALKNIELSRHVEQQYNPENAALRQGSIMGLIAQLGQNPNQDIYDKLNGQFNAAPLSPQTADSDLLKQAIAQASGDLAQGG